MIKVILCGASGRMGGFVASTAAADSDISVVAGLTKSITVKNFLFFLPSAI